MRRYCLASIILLIMLLAATTCIYGQEIYNFLATTTDISRNFIDDVVVDNNGHAYMTTANVLYIFKVDYYGTVENYKLTGGTDGKLAYANNKLYLFCDVSEGFPPRYQFVIAEIDPNDPTNVINAYEVKMSYITPSEVYFAIDTVSTGTNTYLVLVNTTDVLLFNITTGLANASIWFSGLSNIKGINDIEVVYDGTNIVVYLVGLDSSSNGFVAKLVIDPVSNELSQVWAKSLGSTDIHGVKFYNGKVYAVGSYNDGTTTYQAIFVLDDSTGSLSGAYKFYPAQQYFAGIDVVGDKLYVAGNTYDETTDTYNFTILELDPTTMNGKVWNVTMGDTGWTSIYLSYNTLVADSNGYIFIGLDAVQVPTDYPGIMLFTPSLGSLSDGSTTFVVHSGDVQGESISLTPSDITIASSSSGTSVTLSSYTITIQPDMSVSWTLYIDDLAQPVPEPWIVAVVVLGATVCVVVYKKKLSH